MSASCLKWLWVKQEMIELTGPAHSNIDLSGLAFTASASVSICWRTVHPAGSTSTALVGVKAEEFFAL